MNRSCFAITFLLIVFAALAVIPAHGGGGSDTSGPGTAEVRTLNERVPAGGTVQVKNLLTQPNPISSGGAGVALDGFSVDGVAITSPLGDTAGAAVVRDGVLYVSVISPSSDFGTNLDYPFLTVTMDIPATTSAGSTFSLGLAGNTAFQTPTGPLTLVDPKPGTLTIAGTISIHGVYPGGGSWPAGTVITVEGTGFQPQTKISTKMKTTQAIYISPIEMQFTLQEATTLDMQPIQANNLDGSQVVYYSYLRGIPIQPPSRVLLQNTEPIFQTQTHTTAMVGPLTAMGTGQFAALAIQNPNPDPVTVNLHLQSTGATTTINLPSGERVMDEVSALFGGTSIADGDMITVTAFSGIQVFGIYGDENAGTVTPFLPAF